jgi:SNF family Na+-dependent transporter
MGAVRIYGSYLVYYTCFIDIGAFLIPYFCIYFLIGTPLYFLELSVGQFTSRSTTAAFTMSRMFKGIMKIFHIDL